jgi:hypothetical protein
VKPFRWVAAGAQLAGDVFGAALTAAFTDDITWHRVL